MVLVTWEVTAKDNTGIISTVESTFTGETYSEANKQFLEYLKSVGQVIANPMTKFIADAPIKE